MASCNCFLGNIFFGTLSLLYFSFVFSSSITVQSGCFREPTCIVSALFDIDLRLIYFYAFSAPSLLILDELNFILLAVNKFSLPALIEYSSLDEIIESSIRSHWLAYREARNDIIFMFDFFFPYLVSMVQIVSLVSSSILDREAC